MKRFVTYLYEYKNGQRTKNTGHVRVDIRNQRVNMQIAIKDFDLENEKGIFYIIVKKEDIKEISLGEIHMQNGQYNGRISYTYDEDIIGIRICYENSVYMASCWKDGEEETISSMLPAEQKEENNKIEENSKIEVAENSEKEESNFDDQMVAASLLEESKVCLLKREASEFEIEPVYRKVNLNDIYTLPSRHWHFANNSFLIHGFWNYGYLVLKESMEENEKRMSLGVPGIFEQPEMVMATYFGFPIFETLPLQMEEMEIGSVCQREQKENQQSQAGTFGCWFVSL